MRSNWTIRCINGMTLTTGLLITGCHEDSSDVTGVLAIIYAVADVVLSIISATT